MIDHSKWELIERSDIRAGDILATVTIAEGTHTASTHVEEHKVGVYYDIWNAKWMVGSSTILPGNHATPLPMATTIYRKKVILPENLGAVITGVLDGESTTLVRADKSSEDPEFNYPWRDTKTGCWFSVKKLLEVCSDIKVLHEGYVPDTETV